MKVFVTRKQLIGILETAEAEKRLAWGTWAERWNENFRGCAVGNLMHAIAPDASIFAIDRAATHATGVNELVTAAAVPRLVGDCEYLAALSCAYEGTDDFASFISIVRSEFPPTMMIDVDGLPGVQKKWLPKKKARKSKAGGK